MRGSDAALDPPLWIVLNKVLRLSLSLSLRVSGSPCRRGYIVTLSKRGSIREHRATPELKTMRRVCGLCGYYCRAYYKAVCGGGGPGEESVLFIGTRFSNLYTAVDIVCACVYYCRT